MWGETGEVQTMHGIVSFRLWEFINSSVIFIRTFYQHRFEKSVFYFKNQLVYLYLNFLFKVIIIY